MKRFIIKIVLLVVIFIACITIKTYAVESFNIKFGNVDDVKAGDTINVPLIIYNIDTDGANKDIDGFSAKFEYDTSAFELCEDAFEIEEDYVEFLSKSFNNESKSMVFYRSPSYDGEEDASLNKVKTIGTVKFKVKDDAATGSYEVKLYDVVAENNETKIQGNGEATQIYVKGTEEESEEDEDNDFVGESITEEEKELVVEIKTNDDKTKVTIIPDEENGKEIGKIVVNNKEIKREDNKYVFDVEEGFVYNIDIYDAKGNFIGNRQVVVGNDASNQDDNEGNTSSKDKKRTQIAEMSGKSEEDEEQNNSLKQENEKNSPKTGDYVVIAVGLICLSLFTLTVTLMIKKLRQE